MNKKLAPYLLLMLNTLIRSFWNYCESGYIEKLLYSNCTLRRESIFQIRIPLPIHYSYCCWKLKYHFVQNYLNPKHRFFYILFHNKMCLWYSHRNLLVALYFLVFCELTSSLCLTEGRKYHLWISKQNKDAIKNIQKT